MSMPEVEKPEMSNWLDPKLLVSVISLLIAGVSGFYALKVDLATHEARLKFNENIDDWQQKALDIMRSDLSEIKENVATIRTRLDNIK